MEIKAKIFSNHAVKQVFQRGIAIEEINLILSTWHHNGGQKIEKFRNKFNIVTKHHFYHGGGNIENRRTIVEALVCNFELPNINEHNHGLKEKVTVEQMELDLTGRVVMNYNILLRKNEVV